MSSAPTNNRALLPLIGGVGDQGSLGSCVAWTYWRDVLGLALAGQTGTAWILSAMSGYTNSLLLTNKINGVPNTTKITDDGLEPSIAVMALLMDGPSFESEWPYDVSTFGQVENFAQAAAARPRIKLVNQIYAGISATGTELIDAIQQALQPLPDGRIGRAVGFEIPASYAGFQNATGAEVLGPIPDGLQTDHAVSLIDVRISASNHREFLLLNHWSPGWAPEGEVPGAVWVDESYALSVAAIGSTFRCINAELAQVTP